MPGVQRKQVLYVKKCGDVHPQASLQPCTAVTRPADVHGVPTVGDLLPINHCGGRLCPYQRFNYCEKFCLADWFLEKCRCAQSQGQLSSAEDGTNYYWARLRVRMIGQSLQDFPAVLFRQHQIQDDRVGLQLAGQPQRFGCVLYRNSLVGALLEIPLIQFQNVIVVVDQEDRVSGYRWKS